MGLLECLQLLLSGSDLAFEMALDSWELFNRGPQGDQPFVLYSGTRVFDRANPALRAGLL